MKVTRLGPPHPIINSGLGANAGSRIPSGGSDLQVLTSNGSNGRYWGENVRRITSNGSNILLSPDVNLVSGPNIFFAVSSNTLTIHGQAAAAGGVTAMTANGSNSLAGTINLQAGTGIALGVSGSTITITNTGSSGGGGGGSSDFTFIDEVVVSGSSAAQMNITGIPATFRDLVISILARAASGSVVGELRIQVGGGSIDTGANYYYSKTTTGSGDVAAVSVTGTYMNLAMAASSAQPAGFFDAASIEAFAYADSTVVRRFLAAGGYHSTSERYTSTAQGTWTNTADAISRVRATLGTGNFDIGSRMTIYGRG